VHDALAAHDSLKQRGISVRVIDAYSVKPLDVATLEQAARETQGIVVVEDHWRDGGLGDAVAAALNSTVPVHRLAVSKEPRSGTMEQLLERHGISRRAIEEAILAFG
jgi:transketolase